MSPSFMFFSSSDSFSSIDRKQCLLQQSSSFHVAVESASLEIGDILSWGKSSSSREADHHWSGSRFCNVKYDGEMTVGRGLW